MRTQIPSISIEFLTYKEKLASPSSAMAEPLTLAVADYVLFGLMLAVSAGIGVYFRVFGGKQTSNEDYLLAGRDMPVFPVAFSLMATFMSSTTLMGIPSEMYTYGTNMAFMNVGFLLGPILSSVVFLPIYFATGVSTTYEYLERRFGKTTKGILTGIFLFQNVLFNGVSLYAPALALSAVTNLSMWTSILSIGVVCTFYCTLGGMKAVLWSDVFQSALMYVCLLAVVVKGYLDLGGFREIFETAYDGGRIVLPTFGMDVSTRYTMWSVFLQGIIITMFCYGANQIQVQRQLTLRNLSRSRIAALVSSPMLISFHLLCCLCGIIFYAYFKTCHPLTSQSASIHSADQLLPYYITSAMRNYPGLPGLCIAGIFSASLSTISSAVNSMAAVTYEDVIRPLWPNHSRSVLITRTASFFYGILSIFFAFLASTMGNLIKANVLIVGTASGPILGVYLLAALTETTNEVGVNLGALAGFLFAGCAMFIPNDRHYPQLPLENNCSAPSEGLVNFTAAFDDSPVHTADLSSTNHSPDHFPVSYMWICPIALLICLVVGYFGSWISSYIGGYSRPVSRDLLSPVLHWFDKGIRKNNSETTFERKVSKDVAVTRF